MYKSPIRVIKRNNIAASAKVPVVSVANAARIVRHKRVASVNNWITESRENTRLEKAFSESKILGWKMISP
jgi:hypothetical protein